jgi:hypothetical protein
MKIVQGAATLVVAALLSGASFAADISLRGALPDPKMTPGATNPDITQANIDKTICNRGHWSTKSIRPPARYTTQLKRRQIGEYGYADKNLKSYEEDHLISLEIGGSPTDPKNLWPESYAGKYGARVKDKVENAAHRAVCSGAKTLAEVQRGIAENWIKFGRDLGVLR